MRLLAIDTTAHFGSNAMLQDGELLEEMLIHSQKGFGGILFDHIGKLLARHGTRVSEVDCFASATGPGSFTGVRMGLTAVKGLAEATSRPAIGVSNLKALAACGSHAIRAAVGDARRGGIYGAIYCFELQPFRD